MKVKKLNKEAILPTRNNKSDCGLDLYALYDVFIPVNTTTIVDTGIAIQIPENHIGKIEDRSSMATKGLRTGGGIIDPGYSGSVGVIVHNLNNRSYSDPVLHYFGYRIKKGDKIAQLVVSKVELLELQEVQDFSSSDRGNNGYGSSGR